MTLNRCGPEMKQEFAELRAEIAALRTVVADNSQRLSRIEGFLGIGMPPETAANAPGAGLAAASAGVCVRPAGSDIVELNPSPGGVPAPAE